MTPAPQPQEETCRKYWMYRSHSGHLYHLLFDLLGREFPEDESLLADAIMEVRENQTKHDAAIAAQARNATLDDLVRWNDENRTNTQNMITRSHEWWIRRIYEEIKSLRTEAHK